jgi:CBS domain-containing protein
VFGARRVDLPQACVDHEKYPLHLHNRHERYGACRVDPCQCQPFLKAAYLQRTAQEVSMQASDVMTRDVITVTPAASITEAIHLMLDKRISGVPVVDAGGSLVGILTEGDLLRRVETGTERRRPRWLQFLRGNGQVAEEYVQTHGRHVSEVMTQDVKTVGESTTVEDVVGLMEKHHIKRLPVVEGDRLMGVISRADLLRALLAALPADEAAPRSDDDVRLQVIAELGKHEWGEDGRVTVSVTQGTVHLAGIVFDLREADAMRVAAENVPGVLHVSDHLDYVDPNIGVIGVP